MSSIAVSDLNENLVTKEKKLYYGTKSNIVPIISVVVFLGCMVMNQTIGKNNTSVSRHFSLRFTPPGYFFAIWLYIYAATALSLIWAIYSRAWKVKTHKSFWVFCFLNSLWTVVQHQGTTVAVSFSSLILVFQVVNQVYWWVSAGINQDSIKYYSINEYLYLIMRQSIAFQLGWVCAACLLGLNIFLIYAVGISQDSSIFVFWTLFIIVQLAASYMSYKYLGSVDKMITDFSTYYLTACWALIGAAISTASHAYLY